MNKNKIMMAIINIIKYINFKIQQYFLKQKPNINQIV